MRGNSIVFLPRSLRNVCWTFKTWRSGLPNDLHYLEKCLDWMQPGAKDLCDLLTCFLCCWFSTQVEVGWRQGPQKCASFLDCSQEWWMGIQRAPFQQWKEMSPNLAVRHLLMSSTLPLPPLTTLLGDTVFQGQLRQTASSLSVVCR